MNYVLTSNQHEFQCGILVGNTLAIDKHDLAQLIESEAYTYELKRSVQLRGTVRQMQN